MIAVAIISIIAAATVQIGAVVQRREAEDELLAVGLEFKAAIRSYYESTPVGVPSSAPPSFDVLLKDPRFPGAKRHLRKLYRDPITGTTDWGIIHSVEGGILGVYSKALGEPIRRDNFPDEFFHFKGKKRYSDWLFIYGTVCTDAGCEIPRENERAEHADRAEEASRPSATFGRD